LFVLDPPVDELPIELLEDEPPALEPLEAANAGAAATRRAETAVAIVSVFMFPPLGDAPPLLAEHRRITAGAWLGFRSFGKGDFDDAAGTLQSSAFPRAGFHKLWGETENLACDRSASVRSAFCAELYRDEHVAQSRVATIDREERT
jgi:hypothetical protein